MKLLEKVIVAVMSSLILSLILAYGAHTPISDQQENFFSIPLRGLFVAFLIYSLPVYLVCGGVYSYFADELLIKIQLRNKVTRYITGFLVYAIGGILVIGMFVIISLVSGGGRIGIEGYVFFIFGALASLLFFHILLVWRKIISYIVT